MLFNQGMWGGNSCATYYPYLEAPGVSIRFDKPFDEVEGRKCDAVETSKGFIYLRYNVDRKSRSGGGVLEGNVPLIIPDGIEHYSTNELAVWGVGARAQVGVCLLADGSIKYLNYAEHTTREDDKKYYLSLIDSYVRAKKNLEKSLAPVLLYKSEPFFNMIHPLETPYCTVYIYDKGMKHEV